MGERRFIILLLILFLNFLGTIFVIFQMKSGTFTIHFLVSLLFIIIGVIVLCGVLTDRPWTYQLGMLLFAGIIIQTILVLVGKGLFWRISFLMLIDLVAFLICVGSLESYEERKWREMEAKPEGRPKEEKTFDTSTPKVEVYEEKTVTKKASPKKAKKPKAKKKAKKK